MIALDTNVLVRVITRDDRRQAQAALRVLRSGPLWLSKTVLLELEWVLRAGYQLASAGVQRALLGVIGLKNLQVEDRAAVLQALAWHRAGLDLADALHVASSAGAAAFASFDRGLVAAATKASVEPPVVLVR